MSFLSTPSARRATSSGRRIDRWTTQFLSTPSARRATVSVGYRIDTIEISIHALREEGDLGHGPKSAMLIKFLSTPSARRATDKRICKGVILIISIHALREEGDTVLFCICAILYNFYPRPPRGGRRFWIQTDELLYEFLSTPSARRATQRLANPGLSCKISIHALREEGDGLLNITAQPSLNFYPRPPRGGRQMLPLVLRLTGVFLSTPSARRATAKTETKSLFSNKLYNILHEFRRALIYNGSKSYPNHAK